MQGLFKLDAIWTPNGIKPASVSESGCINCMHRASKEHGREEEIRVVKTVACHVAHKGWSIYDRANVVLAVPELGKKIHTDFGADVTKVQFSCSEVDLFKLT